MITTKPSPWVEATETTGIDWLQVARLALQSRALDELEERELTPQGLVKYQFSARGHELSQAIIAQLLGRPGDALSVYYRNRPLMLGCGLTLDEALNNGMANAGSLSGGRDVGIICNIGQRGNISFIPTAADVGSQFTPAAGYAQGLRYKIDVLAESGLDGAIAVAFGGDGSVASNGFWSALNMATTHKLPMLFVIEDNGYAISVSHDLQQAGGNVARNLAAFTNLHVLDGSGTRPGETLDLCSTAVAHARAGAGPVLLRLVVPRLSGHSSQDQQSYKSAGLLASERADDPLLHLHNFVVPALLREADWLALQSEAGQNVRAAAERARQQPLPPQDEVTRFAFSDAVTAQTLGGLRAAGIAPRAGSLSKDDKDDKRINMIDAIRRTLDSELAANQRLLLFGEDVGAKGGVHAATLGLHAAHGPRRVFDTGLNEEGIIGRAVGLAAAGLMPVPEIQFRKYADAAHEHLMNVGSLRWRSAGRCAAPMVVRMPGGYRRLGDPWHSVTNEVAFAHAVGWQVAVPSNAEDAVGLLRTALRGDDPVIFFEHRYCYDAQAARRAYPGDDYALPFGKARIVQPGERVTVVTWGAMVEQCELAAQGIAGVEIIDLRTLSPWDQPSVLESVRKTSRCLIVHEDAQLGGFGAEISAVIAQQAFFDLDAPIVRLGAPQTLIPFSQHLMANVVPHAARIREALLHLLDV